MAESQATLEEKAKPYTFSRILRHTFTGKDNIHIDVARIMWAIGVLAFIGMSAFMIWKTHNFNPLEWGSGFAVVNGGSGAAIKLKEKTEPEPGVG